ncbi:MAG TPA: winged helix-turn-helix transcriptional regulator [Rhodospirillaceae bacterium]|nr:winged helix-turn-helix transcriptional regulator [Rhodospirillaceae bacterium]
MIIFQGYATKLIGDPVLQGQNVRAGILMKAMGNTHRLRILCLLLEGEKSVRHLEEEVGLSQSALSQHLARLRRGRLVKTRRVAQNIFYSLLGHETEAVLAVLTELYGPLN